jgi:TP901 family phage tail tape measure protein
MSETASTLVLAVDSGPAIVSLEKFETKIVAVKSNLESLLALVDQNKKVTGFDKLEAELKRVQAQLKASESSATALKAELDAVTHAGSSMGDGIKKGAAEANAAMTQMVAGTKAAEASLSADVIAMRKAQSANVASESAKQLKIVQDRIAAQRAAEVAAVSDREAILKAQTAALATESAKQLKTVQEKLIAQRAAEAAAVSDREAILKAQTAALATESAKQLKTIQDRIAAERAAEASLAADRLAKMREQSAALATESARQLKITQDRIAAQRAAEAAVQADRAAIQQARDVEIHQMASAKRIAIQEQEYAIWKKLQDKRIADSAATEAALWKNASFAAASPASRLTTGRAAAAASSVGLSDAAIVEKYGTAALVASKNLTALEAAAIAHAKAQAAGTATTNTATSALHRWIAAQRDAHDAARGLSGALGGLWMTYGQMIPMMAGFAIASSMKSAVIEGKNFEYQMKFVQVVTGETDAEMRKLSTSLTHLATSSMFSPLEMASGLRILSQAGLDAQKSLAVLPTVMALATLGETDMTTAAETATGAMYAFGLQISDVSHIGDVIAKAAAISITSVDSMAQSMKQASTVAQQYDVSLGETAAALVALAERNIKGQSAGTAFRNMMNELSSPTQKAQRAMDKLGLSMYDSSGNAKNLSLVMNELRVKLAAYDKESQNLLTSQIFGERGNKAAQAVLSRNAEAWKALMKDIEDSNGFLTKGMIELSNTVEGRFKNLWSTIHASIHEAYKGSEQGLLDLAKALKGAFTSDAFVSGIKALASWLMTLTKLLVENFDVIVLLTKAYLGFHIGRAALALLIPVVTNVASAFVYLRTVTLAAMATQAGWQGFTFLLTQYGAAGAIASSALLGLTGAVTGVRAAAIALNAALLANPIGWITVLIGAMSTALIFLKNKHTELHVEVRESIDLSNQIAAVLRTESDAQYNNVRLLEEELGYRKSLNKEKEDSLRSNVRVAAAKVNKLYENPDVNKGYNMVKRGVDLYSNIPQVTAYREYMQAKKAYDIAIGELGYQKQVNSREDFLKNERTVRKTVKDMNDDAAAGKRKHLDLEDLKKDKSGSKADPVQTIIDNLDKYNDVTQEALKNQGHLTASEKRAAEATKDWAREKGTATEVQKKAYAAQMAELSGLAALERVMYNDTEATKASLKVVDEKIKGINKEAEAKKALIALNAAEGDISTYMAEAQTQILAHQTMADVIEQETNAIKTLETEKSNVSGVDAARTEVLTAEIEKRNGNIKALVEETKAATANAQSKLARIDSKYLKSLDAEILKLNQASEATLKKHKLETSLVFMSEEQAKAAELRAEAEGHYTAAIEKQTLEVERLEAANAALEEATIAAMEAGDIQKIMLYSAALGMSADQLEEVKKRLDALKVSRDKFGTEAAALAPGIIDASRFKSALDEMEGVFAEGFKGMLSGADGAWKKFTSGLKATFKKQVVDEIYRSFIKPIAVKIAASLVGLTGLGSTAAQAGGAAGSAAQGFGGSLLGSSIPGLATAGSYFATGFMNTVAGGGGLFANTAAGLGAASEMGGLSGLSMGIGTIAPYLAGIAAIVGLVKSFGTGGTPHLGSTREFGMDGSNRNIGSSEWVANGGNATGLPGWLFGENGASPYDDAVSAAGKQMVDTINADMLSLGGELGKNFAMQFGFAAENEAETASGGFARVMLDGENVLDIYKRYAKDGKTGLEQFLKEVMPKVELIAIQTMKGLNPAIETLARMVDVSTASAETITSVLQAIKDYAPILKQGTDYTGADLRGDATSQITLAGRTSWEVWKDGNTELRTMAKNFDGSLASAQKLGAATQAMYQSELSLVGQIRGLIVSMTAMIGDSLTTIKMDLLDDAGKYNFIRTQIDGWYAELATATDPTRIQTLGQSINSSTMQAWGMLSPEQKALAGGDFTSFLTDAGTQVNTRLNAAEDAVAASHIDLATSIDAVMTKVAARMMEAAEKNLAAANTPTTVNVNVAVDTPASVEVGYGQG